MTTRLYYDFPKTKRFTARIINRSVTTRGYLVALDQTAFYPTSGGQPNDTGTLDDIPVTDVWDDEDGIIWHLLDAMPTKDEVVGRINWQRRFDHTQQHTGQHILSVAFLEETGANTIGFQIGSETNHIDLEISSLTDETLLRVEKLANRLVWENHPLVIHYVSASEISDIPLRKPLPAERLVRLVWIVGVDVSACGGTHVSATGEIGLIKITKIERYKGNIRVTFLCGNRAFMDYQGVHQNVIQISKELSIKKDELPQAVFRMQDEISDLQKDLKNIRKGNVEIEAERLWNDAGVSNGIKYVYAYLEGRDYPELLYAVNHLRNYPKTVILFAIRQEGKLRLVCSRSQELEEIDSVKILKNALIPLNGKGGGTPEIAQGGAPLQNHQVVIQVLQTAITQS